MFRGGGFCVCVCVCLPVCVDGFLWMDMCVFFCGWVGVSMCSWVCGCVCLSVRARVGTIQYVYRSVSIPYSTPVSCMVSPSPNEDPGGTTKCPDSLVLRYIQADSNNQTFVPKTPENFNKYLSPQT